MTRDCGSEDRDVGEYCAEHARACDACRDAIDAASEAAFERACADYYGGDTPQTVQEQYEAAARERRREGRR